MTWWRHKRVAQTITVISWLILWLHKFLYGSMRLKNSQNAKHNPYDYMLQLLEFQELVWTFIEQNITAVNMTSPDLLSHLYQYFEWCRLWRPLVILMFSFNNFTSLCQIKKSVIVPFTKYYRALKNQSAESSCEQIKKKFRSGCNYPDDNNYAVSSTFSFKTTFTNVFLNKHNLSHVVTHCLLTAAIRPRKFYSI